MGFELRNATPMYVDNFGAVELSKERRSCQRSRHVDRRDLKVLKYVAHGYIEVRKIHTDDNVAGVFTKALPAAVHSKYVNAARNRYWASVHGGEPAPRSLSIAGLMFDLDHSHVGSFRARGVLIDPLYSRERLYRESIGRNNEPRMEWENIPCSELLGFTRALSACAHV
eukprot:2440610-Pleurochrysis_carterae.AAC.5